MLAPKAGGDEGDLFAIEQSDQWHRARLICLRAESGELNDIPAEGFRNRVLPICHSQDGFVNMMNSGRDKSGHRAQHQEPVQ